MPVKTFKVCYDSKENIYKYFLIDVRSDDNLTLSYNKLYEIQNKTKNKKLISTIFKLWIKKFLSKQNTLEVSFLNHAIRNEILDSVDDLKILFKSLNLEKYYLLISGVFALYKYKVSFNKLSCNIDYELIEEYIDKNLLIDEYFNENDFIIEQKINFNYFLKEILQRLCGDKVASCIKNFKNGFLSDKFNFNKNMFNNIIKFSLTKFKLDLV